MSSYVTERNMFYQSFLKLATNVEVKMPGYEANAVAYLAILIITAEHRYLAFKLVYAVSAHSQCKGPGMLV